MKFLELCAGIGGFRVALENLGCECVGYSEIDKNAIKLYSAFFNDERNFGDVTKINAEALPDFDLLVGGFPCQAFSIAGKRMGFDDTRGTIFFDFARILKGKKPKFAIFENVKGLLNHDGGKTYETILQTLNELGYDAQWGILNTKFHGLPQNRERVYIVANLRERSSTKILFERGDGITDKMERTEQSIIGDYYTKNGKTHQWGGVIGDESIAPCLMAGEYKSPRIVKIGSIGAKTGLYNVEHKVRRLTPKECFRLQGFKDEMVELGYKLGISDTQLYKMAGNAVSVPVVEWVAQRVLNWDNLRNADSDYLF
ncbi:MAG: DNA (cytosine-5-)-methyltransferase [Campylobacter sp.]|nr:DNA (cytosine-5-)-methyltransferase [Campylobacter sp.]